jgi:hypothetical protein
MPVMIRCSTRWAGRFENAFQGVARMILESDIEKVVVNGKTTYDFSIFRTGKKAHHRHV